MESWEENEHIGAHFGHVLLVTVFGQQYCKQPRLVITRLYLVIIIPVFIAVSAPAKLG